MRVRLHDVAGVARVALAMAALLGGPHAGAAPRSAPGAEGGLRVSVHPAALVLGRDGAAELRIEAPAEVTEVTVTTNAGRVERVRRHRGGGFTARYVPPAERVPRVAIVAALARGAEGPLDGWVAIPLHGTGRARVRSRPDAEIALRIGERTFGPVRADAEGNAAIAVVVPPGVREGYHGFRPVDLGVPETSLVHAIADRAEVRADEPAEIHFRAYVVAPHGTTRRGDVPEVEASRGTFAYSAREAGAIAGVWRLAPGPAGEARLTFSLPGAPASRAVVKVEAVPGPPAAVAVAFDREALVAGSGPSVAVTARVLDAAGNPTAAPLALAADAGALSPAAEHSPGVYTASLAVPPRFGGRAEVTVTARVPGTALAGTRALPLRPGAPAQARLDADVLVADGGERALRLALRDAWDNPVRATPAVAIGRGNVVAIAPAEPGVYLVRYRTPAVAARTPVALEADVGGVRTRTDLVLVPARRDALATAFGLLTVDGGARPWLALSAERGLARDDGRLALRAELGASGWRRDGFEAGLAAGTVGPALRRAVGPRLEAWSAAGAGLALGYRDTDDGGRDVRVGPALRLAAGLAAPRAWGTPFLELGVVTAWEALPGRGAVAGVTASIGLRLDGFPGGARSAEGPGPRSTSDGDHPHRR